MQTLDINTYLNESEEEKTPRIDAIYDYLTDYLGLSDKNELKETDLTSYLNDIIAGTSNENVSDNKLVGSIINLIEIHAQNSMNLN